MPLFKRRREAEPSVRNDEAPTDAAGYPTIAGLDAWMRTHGWQSAPPQQPFGGHLEGEVHMASRVMYGAPPRNTGVSDVLDVGPTSFNDAYRGQVGGRGVTVANAWTYLHRVELTSRGGITTQVAVCAVELGAVLPIVCIQPRAERRMVAHIPDTPTGSPDFDARFAVTAAPIADVRAVLTPDVQRRILAHDDWWFVPQDYLFGVLRKGAFTSVDDIRSMVDDVLAIVAAIPASVMPATVDRSVDDLLARIARIETVDEALAFLQQLTPDDRTRLAASDTPLAAFADVRTPDEAIARLQSLPPAQQMQIMAMFERVGDDSGRG